MNVTKFQVESILKTLPIGYYCDRDVKVKLEDGNDSYYDIMHDEIHISYPMIKKVITSLPESMTIENDIRCLLYHEVSHAFLTPKQLAVTNIMNIFEDERIESILRNYYKGVNFRQFVMRVNNFHNEAPQSAMEAFYQIVRYRIGPKEFVDKVSKIINNYQSLADDDIWMYDYHVQSLFNDVKAWFNEQEQTKNHSSISNDKHESIIAASNIVDNSDVNDMMSNEEIKTQIKQTLGKFDSSELSNELNKILSSIKHVTKSNGSAINAYSGKFDPRSVIRNDYKWFVQQNRIGHVKAFSKLHLNLFIDESGSFEDNDICVNKLLKALIRFEKSNPDFSFDLISCGEGQRIRAKYDRYQESSTGTCISEEIFEQYRRQQFPDCHNINIILYDGDVTACSYARRKDDTAKNLAAFDNAHCICILDEENEHWANKYLTHSKVIITNNYVQELQHHVLNALKILSK